MHASSLWAVYVDPAGAPQLIMGKRFLYGKGIYTSPDPAVAAHYAARCPVITTTQPSPHRRRH